MAAEPERAEVDLLIERADLGPGCTTLVAAVIPPELAALPQQPRSGEPPPKRKR